MAVMSKSVRFPRALIVCHSAPQQTTGGGVLLRNLFHSFPDENLMFIHRDRLDQLNADTPSNSVFLQNKWFRLKPCGAIGLIVMVLGLLFKKSISLNFQMLKTCSLEHLTIKFPKSVQHEIAAFNPDLIYFWGGSIFWNNLALSLSRWLQKPLAVHFMDHHFSDKNKTRRQNQQLLSNTQVIVNRSSKVFVISEAMKTEYERLFGKDCIAFHGLIDKRDLPASRLLRAATESKCVYMGSIENTQIDSITDVARAIDQHNKARPDERIAFDLYLAEVYRRKWWSKLTKFESVRLLPHPTTFPDVINKMTGSRFLLMAYNFDEVTINYYRFSFATKVLAYMASKRPIIAYGPPDIEPINFLSRNKFAEVVAQRGVDNVIEAIEKTKLPTSENKTSAAFNYVIENHELIEQSKRFAIQLGEACEKSKRC